MRRDRSPAMCDSERARFALRLPWLVAIAALSANAAYAAQSAMRLHAQVGHSAAVTALAISNDGRLAVTGSSDRNARVWAMDHGYELRTIVGHLGTIVGAAISPDGARAYLASKHDGSVKEWDLASGREIRTFHKKERAQHSLGDLSSLALSADGARLAAGSMDGTVFVWKTADGALATSWHAHGSTVAGLAFSPDGQRIATAGGDSVVTHWDLKTAKAIWSWKAKRAPRFVRFSPSGAEILSGGFDNQATIIQAASGTVIKSVTHKASVADGTFTPDGGTIWTVSDDKKLSSFDSTSGKQRFSDSLESKPFKLALASSGDLAFVAGDNGFVAIWDIHRKREAQRFNDGSVRHRKLVVARDGKSAVTVSGLNYLHFWDLVTGAVPLTFSAVQGSATGRDSEINDVELSADGRIAITAVEDGTVCFWDSSNGASIGRFTDHDAPVHSLAVSDDGTYLASGDADGTVMIWDLTSKKAIKTIPAGQPVVELRFSPDGKRIATGFAEISDFRDSAAEPATLAVWSIADGKVVARGRVNGFAFEWARDGSRILGFSNERQFLTWDLTSAPKAVAAAPLNGTTKTLSLSPDGRLAVLGGSPVGFEDTSKPSLEVWDLAAGKRIHDFDGITEGVRATAFLPGTRRVISSSGGALHIWDSDSGRCLAHMHATHDGEWLAWTDDGYFDSSPEGSAGVAWVEEPGTDAYGPGLLAALFHRPEVVRARMRGDLNAGVPAARPVRPPRVRLVSAAEAAIDAAGGPKAKLAIQVEGDAPVEQIEVLVDGRRVADAPVGADRKEISISVPLFARSNRVAVIARDEKKLLSHAATADVACTSCEKAAGTLHLVAVGVSKYPNMGSAGQLSYAHSDASAVARAFENQKGSLFRDVRTTVLTDAGASREAIDAALNGLAAASANDLAVVFLAGHGARDSSGKFFFLPTAGRLEDPAADGIDWHAIAARLAAVKARTLLLLDACHSGAIVGSSDASNDRLAAEAARDGRGGVVVFSAAKGRQQSLESPELGGGAGLFSHSIVRALGQDARAADGDASGFVEFTELADQVRRSVRSMVGVVQTPWVARREIIGDFPLAVVRAKSE